MLTQELSNLPGTDSAAAATTLAWGRPILPSDTGSVAVGVVNDAVARRHWPGGDWSGRRIALDSLPADNTGWIQMVGVARDMRTAGLSTPPEPTRHLPLAAEPWSSFFVLMRTSLDPASSVAPARAAVHGHAAGRFRLPRAHHRGHRHRRRHDGRRGTAHGRIMRAAWIPSSSGVCGAIWKWIPSAFAVPRRLRPEPSSLI